MFAFNMLAGAQTAFQAVAPKADIVVDRVVKTGQFVRRKSFGNKQRPEDVRSMNVETGQPKSVAIEDDEPEVYYRRQVTRDYSQSRGRPDRRRIERRRSHSSDSEASMSPPPRRIRAPSTQSAVPNDPRDMQLAVRSKSDAVAPVQPKAKSAPASEASDDSDLPSSGEDEREAKHLKRRQHLMTGISAIATANMAANFWLSVKASHDRDKKVKDGKMTVEEARKEKIKNSAQDIASIGAAVLTVKVVRNRWKMTQDQMEASEKHHTEREKRREKRRQRAEAEWEIESLSGSESDVPPPPMGLPAPRGVSGSRPPPRGARASRPPGPRRVMSYSDDEYDRHGRNRYYYDRNYAPRITAPPHRGSYAGSAYGGSNYAGSVSGSQRGGSQQGSNSGRRSPPRQRDSSRRPTRKRQDDGDEYVEHAFYDPGYNAPEITAHPDPVGKYGDAQRGNGRERAQSVYSPTEHSYDGRRGPRRGSYEDEYYNGRDRERGDRRRSRDRGGRRDRDEPYREVSKRNQDMMNLGNF